MQYQKLPLTYEEQISLLMNRGLRIDDRENALKILQSISYYRLRAYFSPFQRQNDEFYPETKIEDIKKLYSFDQKLRLLILSAIEPIEIALRTQIIYHLSHQYDVFGYLKSINFSNKFNHTQWLKRLKEDINQSTETFLGHYRKKYTLSVDFPLWMALEVISFGHLSYLFKGLKSCDQQAISKFYELNDKVLVSWVRALSYLRNVCAHHARLWDRTLTIKPQLPKESDFWKKMSNDHIYCLLCIIKFILTKINLDEEWSRNLKALIISYPAVNLTVMNFPKDWINEKMWC